MEPQPTLPANPMIPPVTPSSKPKRNVLMLAIGGVVILGVVIALVVGFILWKHPPKQITSYEECVKANGNAIQPMYPGVCYTAGGQRFTQELTEEENKKINPPDPTANWKTYANTKNGYSFKYPSDWELDYYQGSSTKLTPKELSESNYVSIGKFTSDGQSGYSISVSGNQSQMGKPLSCKSDISDPNCLRQFLDSPPIPNYQTVKLGQTPAIKFLEPPLDYPTIVFVKNGILIMITYTPNPYQNLEPVVSQILSTFRFIDDTGKSCQSESDCGSGYICISVVGNVSVDENGKETTPSKTCYPKDEPLPQ